MNPLIAFSLVWIPVVTVLGVGAVRYMWQLYQREQVTFADRRRVTLMFVLAAVTTVAFVAGAVFLVPVVAFILNAPIEVRRITGNFVVIGIDLLLPLPLVIAVYLRRRL